MTAMQRCNAKVEIWMDVPSSKFVLWEAGSPHTTEAVFGYLLACVCVCVCVRAHVRAAASGLACALRLLGFVLSFLVVQSCMQLGPFRTCLSCASD